MFSSEEKASPEGLALEAERLNGQA